MTEVSKEVKNPETQELIKDGIEKCEDLCTCGEHLRLHAFTFGRKQNKPKQRYYIDCPKCGKVTDWHDTIDEAIAAFDGEVSTPSAV